MDDKPRFAIRHGAIPLTRRQWAIFGGIVVTGTALAVILITAVSVAAGATALGTAGVAAALTLGFGRRRYSQSALAVPRARRDGRLPVPLMQYPENSAKVHDLA